MKKGKGGKNGLLPNSLRIISSCLKTVSDNAGSVATTVRSAGASVAASIAVPPGEDRDQVLWAGFDKLELGSSFRQVLLLGYSNGFQVLDVEDASNVCELVSKRDGPVTFLQMQPLPAKSEGSGGFIASHPLLLVVAGDETNGLGTVQGGRLSALIKDCSGGSEQGNCISTPTVVRFFSLRSHNYVHVLRFRSAVYIVRCSPRIVAVALAAQIYCFDAVTLENRFSVLTYPLQGAVGVNVGYGPMAIGPRWLAYSSNNPLVSNTGRLSPQNLSPSPGVSPSTSPGNGSLVARYAMESSKQLAAGIINLGDMGYKTLSKYCQELLPDGSNSPLSANSARKVGRLPQSQSEADNAGMVVVKDFVSKEVISQFRAHTSPISALCFDPSGTVLVTASVHGHNINVFRIMPTLVPNGSSPARYDWSSSHVHLYKLYRGITTAVIQDICFSNFSQWVAIVSSRGTCHIFVLSPFGGDSSLQPQSPHTDGPSLTPNLSSPWWSTSLYVADQHFLPPPPMSLSVVGRIKNGSAGWLNTVSNVAASAAGKATIPSGAIAAVFHNSKYHENLPAHPKANPLEYLLVYSPSGHLIQHELLPSLGVDSPDSGSKLGAGSLLQLPDEESHVNAEPVQWWDVCRRSNWPEREESISNVVLKRQNSEMIMDTSDCEDNYNPSSLSSTNSMAGKEFVRSNGKPHLYLSNAEVQINSGRVPIWQKSKICFYIMSPLKANGISVNEFASGEMEIEKLQVDEVEIRRKDLLPVFEQFHSFHSDWNDRSLDGRKFKGLPETIQAREHSINDTFARHSNPPSPASGSDIEGLTYSDATGVEGPSKHAISSHSVEKSISFESVHRSFPSANKTEDENMISMPSPSEMYITARRQRRCIGEDSASSDYQHSNSNSVLDSCVTNGFSPPVGGSSCDDEKVQYPSIDSSCEMTRSCIPTSQLEQVETSDSHNSVEFVQYFKEGYCKVSELDDCRELTEAVTDADSSSSHCEREKPEEDGETDDMLGGVFAFCEEG